MVEEAGRVVFELEARTGAFKAASRESAQTFDQATSQIERSAGRAEVAVSRSMKRIGDSAAAAGQRSRLLGYQISDIGTQLASGSNPFLILAQQAPQVANALEGTTGVAGRMAAFFSGPWGAALLAAGSVLGILAKDLFKTAEGVDDLVEKLKKHARETELSERAAAIFARTMEGEREAARKLNEELNAGLKTQQDLTEATYRDAQAHLANELAIRRVLSARLAEAETAARILGGPGISSERGIGLARQEARRRAEDLRKQIEENDRAIRIAEQNVLAAAGNVASDSAARATDPIKKINDQYDQMAVAARKASAENRELAKSLEGLDQAGRNAALARERQRLTGQLADIERRRQAALKREEDRQRASRQGPDADRTGFLRPVAGGRVTGQFGEQRGNRGHGGVDIAVPVGTQVSAAAGGTVIETGIVPGYGRVVVIDHGRGTITRYAHLSSASVLKGQSVDAGQVIGLSGGAKGAEGAGNSRGPHLHYEVRRSGRAVNPFGGPFPTDSLAAQRGAGEKDPFADLRKSLNGLKKDTAEAIADFRDLEKEFDPAAASAREFANILQRIENARLTGLIDDATALKYRLEATTQALKPLLEQMKSPLVSGARSRRDAIGGDKATLFGSKDDVDAANREAEDQIRGLAGMYEELFSNGTRGIWDEFKRQALEALAIVAAQETFKLLTGRDINLKGGGGNDLVSLLSSGLSAAFGGGGGSSSAIAEFTSAFGRSGGGFVNAGQLVRINEGAAPGRVEGWRPQGAGHVIPLGQMKAAHPISAPTIIHAPEFNLRGAVITPELYRDMERISREGIKAAAPHLLKAASKQVPASLAKYQSDGT